VTRYDAGRDALAAVLAGEPSYRVDQVWDALYRQHLDPEGMTNVPKRVRALLESELPAALDLAAERSSDRGATVKHLWRLHDGRAIESVLMRYRDRVTVCVSTQAGCAMGCGFCATGQAGFERHLTTGEIVEQVIRAAQRSPARVSNVVFMGMGEPLANYDNVWRAIERLQVDMGISARHLTLSTIGIVPGIVRLAGERLPVNLAVSLHAANDDLRNELIPMNRRYPLSKLAAACRSYIAAKNRRLSFEWALIDGVNDRPSDAAELAAYARPLHAHVNLIPLNATPGWPTRGTPPDQVQAFRDRLEGLGVNATVRRNRGTDIDAACGQLRASIDGAAPVEISARARSSARPPGSRASAAPAAARARRATRRTR
jgi:23S rRNA (adenine2503-C2)-methyltransferase